jgi:hypothetical protein
MAAGSRPKFYQPKVIRAETKALGNNRVEAVVSSELKDRDGDIIRVAGWELADFLRHPVLLSSHNYGSLRSQIGHWESMEPKGKKLVGVAQYYVGEGNDEADWGYNLATKGRAAYSVGFRPDMSRAKEIENADGVRSVSYEYNGQTLLEVSQVVIPANQDALQIIRTAKALHPVVGELIDEALAELKLSDSPSLAGLEAVVETFHPDRLKAEMKALLPELLRELTQPLIPPEKLAIPVEDFRKLLNKGAQPW